MRSYDSATLVKTPDTRSVFSDSETVSKPKCVFFSAPLASEVASRRTDRPRVLLGGCSERQSRVGPKADRTSGLAAILLIGTAEEFLFSLSVSRSFHLEISICGGAPRPGGWRPFQPHVGSSDKASGDVG